MITVVIILAILVSLSIPLYLKTVERTKNKEAKTMLQLIYQAEKMYRLEQSGSGYISCNDTDDCNSKLDLSINSQNWDFRVTTNNTVSPPTMTITVTRQGVDNRIIILRSSAPDTYICISDSHPEYCD